MQSLWYTDIVEYSILNFMTAGGAYLSLQEALVKHPKSILQGDVHRRRA